MKHVGKVIIVGGDAADGPQARLHAGVDDERRVRDRLATPSAGIPTITHIKTPPLLIADVK